MSFTDSKTNSLGIGFDGLSTFRLIHHFPETHQLPLCHNNFLKMTHYVTWMKGCSCQNNLRKQASRALHEVHVDESTGLNPTEHWRLFLVTFHFKKGISAFQFIVQFKMWILTSWPSVGMSRARGFWPAATPW